MTHRSPLLARAIAWSALLVGMFGVLVCLAAGVATWMIGSRLQRANTIVFEVLDISLTTAHDRVVRVEQRVKQSKITLDEIEDRLKTWAEREARERLAVRLKVIETAEKLSDGLHEADGWLEMSAESVRIARRTLELGSTIGGRTEPASLDPILENLTTFESKIEEAGAVVDQVRQVMDAVSEADPQSGAVERVLQLAARVVATIGDIEQRLGALADRLSQLREQSNMVRARIHRSILASEVILTILLIWMACGQGMLCRWGLKHSRPLAPSSDPLPSS